MPRFAGITACMRLLVEVIAIDVAVFGVPFDLGVEQARCSF